MPSPVGHTLAAATCAWIIVRPYRSIRRLVVQVALLGLLSVAPDFDLLLGTPHRAHSHSVGVALLVALLVAWQRWPLAETRWRIGCVAFLAWASHPLIDAFGVDTKIPLGVMAWWPLSSSYFIAPWQVFLSISRNWHSSAFLVHNGLAVLRELAILGPPAAAVWWLRRPTAAPSPRPHRDSP